MKQLVEVIFEADSIIQSFELTANFEEEYELAATNDGDFDILLDSDTPSDYDLDILEDESLNYVLDSGVAIVNYIEGEIYDGPTTITPSQDTQILQTNGFVLTKDITVAAIPSNYGLITWNGSVLTVS